MNFNFTRFHLLFVGGCLLVLLDSPQCQGARYSNSLDLNENEMTSLLDELSLPQHRIRLQEKPKPYPWHNLLRRGDDGSGGGGHPTVYYDYERPLVSTRRRRIVVKMKRKRKPNDVSD